MRTGTLADQLRRDLSFAARMLGRNRGFAAVAIATLALGIGASTAIFTVADAVVFRPMPYDDPSRLVKIWSKGSAQPTDDVSWADFEDIRAAQDVFEQVAADDGMGFELTSPTGSREPINGGIVTSEWLSTLGVRPLIGRMFLPDETEPGRDRVAMLSHAYWQRRFASNPNVVGTILIIDGSPFSVIGVLPPNVLRYGADFLKPLVPAEYPRDRAHRDLDVIARLRAEVTMSQAQAALDTIAARLAREYPTTNAGRGFRVEALGKYYASVAPHAERGLLLMLAAVGLVLLIACANVVNLLLARALTRSRECVIRTALGATRSRLVRQMLVETVLLFVVGGAVGILVARWSIDALLAFAITAGYVPDRMAVAVDARVLAFSFVVSLAAGVLFGIVPALQASRVDLNAGLTAANHTSSVGTRRTSVSGLLIVAEIAVALVLLVGSGLIVRSFVRLQSTSAGINADNLLLIASDGGRDFPVAVRYWQMALDRVRQFPGVQSAAITSRPPVHGARRQQFVVDVHPGVPASQDDAGGGDILVSEDYFRTMGIPLLQGRAFVEQDDALTPPVAIVSHSLARRYFPNGNAVGRRVMLKETSPMRCCSAAAPVEGVWREIVGVAADVRQSGLDEQPAMTIYRPYSQIVEHDMYLMVRAQSDADATRIAANLRQHLLAGAPASIWSDVRAMHDVIDGSESLRLRRFVLTLLASFATAALLLAAVGTYGVMACAVIQRTKEIGIRMALGATRARVLRQVVGAAMRLTVAGLVVGAIAAYFSTRFIATLLFEIDSGDAVTYASVASIVACVALLAAYVPARRATRIDPLLALRQE